VRREKTTIHNKSASGFSLVELSIVLVILGLLTGGILGGQELIKAAELRKVLQEAEGYRLAINNFRLKYNGLPGDFNMAERFWGEANATLSTCYDLDKTTVAGTCDGNGNGQIAEATAREEHFLAWHHMQQAGLISGTYTGATSDECGGSCSQDHVPGENCPSSAKGNNIGWTVAYKGESTGSESNPNWFLGHYGHIFIYGAAHVNGDAATNKPALSPNEVWNIDTKMDDGRPAKGNVVVRTSDYPGLEECTETSQGSGVDTFNTDLEAVYRLSEGDNIHCSFILRNIL
jgi:prepilin-type N-terminal cleavage/methylation domain-containing protein